VIRTQFTENRSNVLILRRGHSIS